MKTKSDLQFKNTTPEKTCQVALYERVSSQEQAQNGVSLGEQAERLELLAKIADWHVYDHYCDEGISGGIDDRPHLQRLMADARAGRINLVAVTKLDRFFRNTRLLLNYIYELENCGVGFIAQAEGIDTRKPGIGKITLSLLGSIAEWERERIGQRVSDFRRHLASKGRWSSGRTPFGYRFNKQTKELEIDEAEAQAVRFAFTTYVVQRIGIIKLAEAMNQESLPTPRMGRRQHTTWTQSAVRHILTHPAYKGGPNEQWQFRTPATVEPEIWAAAQKQLSHNQHFRTLAKANSKYRGRLRCGICGHTLRIGYSHSITPVYECPGRLKRLHLDGSERCTLPRFKATSLDETLTHQIEEISTNPETFVAHIKHTLENLESEHLELEARLRPLQAKAGQIKEDMSILDARLEMHRISPEVYKERMRTLQNKLRDIKQRTIEADPLLLEQLYLNDLNHTMYQGFLKGIQKHGQYFIESWISRVEAQERKSPTSQSKLTLVDMHNKVFANVLNNGVCFVFPSHIEVKGNVKSGQAIVSPSYRSDRYRQFQ